ncbi:MAG: SPFH domain-containing protein [Micavibrio sp.]|nr:SPFH domain-containing protein [Micavibrio sp.]
MGLMNFISKQFVDVIQWTDPATGVLAYRYPMQDKEIQNGGKLVVRESQVAVFFNEGVFADKFGPGTYTLTTQNLPVLTNLKNWDKFFESPFKSDVYFFSTREITDQKWGTSQPITIRDKEFGALRIRAFGNYSYKVADVEAFWTKLVGTRESYGVQDAEGQLRTAVLTAISSFLAKSDTAFIDMAANQADFSAKLMDVAAPVFKNYGLELKNFFVQSISLPEEMEKVLDKVSSMRMLGDLKQYAQFQAADSISAAASNPGGVAGAGVGMGAGLAMGQLMSQSLGMGGGNAAAPDDPIVMIERLSELLKKGILTEAEFNAKKADLLSKIK